MSMIEDGDYDVQIKGAGVLYENSNGTLVAMFECAFLPDLTTTLNAYFALTKRDGGLNEYALADIKRIFPQWDGSDPAWLTEAGNTSGAPAIARVVQEGQYSNIKNLYGPEGPQSKGKDGMKADMLRKKYGAKFRAVSGGQAKDNLPF